LEDFDRELKESLIGIFKLGIGGRDLKVKYGVFKVLKEKVKEAKVLKRF